MSIYNQASAAERIAAGASTHNDPSIFERSEQLLEHTKVLRRAEQEAFDRLKYDMEAARRASLDGAAEAARVEDFSAEVLVSNLRHSGQWHARPGDAYGRGYGQSR
ncbi:hypothetical protein ACFOYW_13395 [Gryllotalpicola reticulitermitis]|uniref:Uncharacterized protein n=1 Tax=Gryllotalpicola reticulitermitis TaxID=1184153 RepID=A0ABV8Q981_9MICO